MTSEEKLEILKKDLAEARISYDIWRELTNIDNEESYEQTMEKYSEFFRSVIRCQFQNIIIILYRVFETRNETVNFPKLIEQMLKDNQLTELEQNKLKEIENQTKQHWHKVCKIRSEIYAHRSSEKKAKLSLSPNNIIELMNSFESIFNELYYILIKKTFHFEFIDWVETKQLMLKLKQCD